MRQSNNLLEMKMMKNTNNQILKLKIFIINNKIIKLLDKKKMILMKKSLKVNITIIHIKYSQNQFIKFKILVILL
jgi:hypothetical protein